MYCHNFKILFSVFFLLITLSFSNTKGNNIVSTAIGGSWNATNTWVAGVLPGAADTVTIADGAAVIITTSPTCAVLIVGEGTSGILMYQNSATQVVLVVTGTTTINSGAIFEAYNVPTVSGYNFFSTSGSIINNGTINFNISSGLYTSSVSTSITDSISGLTYSGSGTNNFGIFTLNDTAAAPGFTMNANMNLLSLTISDKCTFTTGSNTLTLHSTNLDGYWCYINNDNGGTLNPTNSTIVLTDSNAAVQYFFWGGIQGNITGSFNNIIINPGSATTVYQHSGATSPLTINGTLTLQQGTFYNNYPLTLNGPVNGSGTLQSTGQALIIGGAGSTVTFNNITGSGFSNVTIQNSPDVTVNGSFPTTATLTMTGGTLNLSSDLTITSALNMNGGTLNMPDNYSLSTSAFVINGGTVNMGSINSNMTITDTFTLSSGIIYMGNNFLNYAGINSMNANTGNCASYFSFNGGAGGFKWTLLHADSIYQFPIGINGVVNGFRPVTLKSTGTPNFTVGLLDMTGGPTCSSTNIGLIAGENSMAAYIANVILNAAAAGNTTVTMEYGSSDFFGTPSTVDIYNWNGTEWNSLGTSAGTNGANDCVGNIAIQVTTTISNANPKTFPLNLATQIDSCLTPYTWTGAVSTNWNDIGNWSGGSGSYPQNGEHVFIGNTGTYQPTLNVSGVIIGNLTINAGFTFDLGGDTLTVQGNIYNKGTINSGTTGSTINMNGSSAQTMGGGAWTAGTTGALLNLVINNAAGVTLDSSLAIQNQLTLTSGILTGGSNLIPGTNVAPFTLIRTAGILAAAPTFLASYSATVNPYNIIYNGGIPITTGFELWWQTTKPTNGTLTVTNGTDVTLQNGYNPSIGNLVTDTGTTFNINGQTLTVTGDVDNNGTINSSAGNSTLTMNGSGTSPITQIIQSSGGTGIWTTGISSRLLNLNIDNTSPSGIVNLNTSIVLQTSLYLTAGDLATTNSSILTLGDGKDAFVTEVKGTTGGTLPISMTNWNLNGVDYALYYLFTDTSYNYNTGGEIPSPSSAPAGVDYSLSSGLLLGYSGATGEVTLSSDGCIGSVFIYNNAHNILHLNGHTLNILGGYNSIGQSATPAGLDGGTGPDFGTLNFTGNTAAYIRFGNQFINASQTYVNLSFNNPAFVGIAGNFIPGGAYAPGTMYINNMVIDSGTIGIAWQTNVTDETNLNIIGNIINNSAIKSIYNNSNKITLAGTTQQTISGTGIWFPGINYLNFIINNSYATVPQINVNCNLSIPDLTLFSGVVYLNPGDVLHVINAATTAITGGSASTYIQGPLSWTLLNNVSADGDIYNYPVGDAGNNYRPFELANVRTGNATPVVKVTLAQTGALTFDSTILSLNPRNWRVDLLSGDFISSTIGLTADSVATYDVAQSTSQPGIYTSIGNPGFGTTIFSNPGITIPVSDSAFFALGNELETAAYEINTNSNGTIYPNPCSSSVNFTFNSELTNAQLELFDVTGRELNSIIFSGKQLTIDRGNLPSGVYLYKCISENKINCSGKIVIM